MAKVCNTCGAEKPLSEFHFRSDTNKPRSDCIVCFRSKSKKRYEEREETKEAYVRASHKFNVKRYGLSLESYDQMFEDQDGKCKICGTTVYKPTDQKGMLETACIDHCHETGKVRGLLCRKCNTGIGSFKESLTVLRCAVDYLENSL